MRLVARTAVLAVVLSWARAAVATEAGATEDAAAAIVAALRPPGLQALAREVLERNPEIAVAAARARAAEAVVPQVRSLDDPMAALNVFLLPPETRVGPQRMGVSLSQKVPWIGKLALRERAALFAAAAAKHAVEARRLEAVTEGRRLAYELAFLAEHAAITREERQHLMRHEEAARARYVAGVGLQQAVVKIQAAITREDQRLLDIEARRRSLEASLNALRDRPAEASLPAVGLPEPLRLGSHGDALRQRALAWRPELAGARAGIERGRVLVELAEKRFKPDFTFGLGYTRVDRRQDPAGRLNPPPDDGDDVVALSAGINLPIRRARLAAGLTEALELLRLAEAEERRILARMEREIGDHASRLPLLYEHWSLLDRVLIEQAEEALRSAEGAYATGRLGALDLLDAEHVLFEVRTARARTRADHAIAHVRLEHAVGGAIGGDLQESDKRGLRP